MSFVCNIVCNSLKNKGSLNRKWFKHLFYSCGSVGADPLDNQHWRGIFCKCFHEKAGEDTEGEMMRYGEDRVSGKRVKKSGSAIGAA